MRPMMIRTAMLATVLMQADAAFAQSLMFSSNDPDKPIEVTAQQGIEWQQNDKRFIARGKARAAQADVAVTADQLTAHYRAKADGGTEVFRVDASGNVTISSASETATGDAAVYDFDKAVLVLEGEDVSLKTESGTVTAQKALQYWTNERVAVAEGNATAKDSERTIRADKLTAFFSGAQPGGARPATNAKRGDITYMQAVGNVRLQTAKEVVIGDRGNYDLQTGIATLDGSVKMTQNNNQLSGGYAVVNVKTGISRLYGSAAEAGQSVRGEDSRVKALLAPRAATPTPSAVPQATPGPAP